MNKISLAEAKSKSQEIVMAIEKVFLDNEIMGELTDVTTVRFDHYTASQATVYFEITGDFRHAHRYADHLVEELYPSVSIQHIEDDESLTDDWYTATHIYTLRTDNWETRYS